MQRRRRKVKTPQPPPYELIARGTIDGTAMYGRLQTLIDEREELAEARVALAWCNTWKADRYGHVTLGKCIKASELHRELAPYDGTIVLNQAWWYDVNVPSDSRQALLFHELCHLDVVTDRITGERQRDVRGRLKYCIRPHDVEEFHAVISRFGLWKRDLEQQYAAMVLHARQGFVPCEACRDSGLPGYVALEDGKTLQRCACWQQWQARTQLSVAS